MKTEVSVDDIPHEDIVVLESSSFFQKNPKGTKFPTTQEIRSAHEESMHGKHALNPQAPHVVRYPSLGLCVKYSQRVRLNEARALCLVNRYLGRSFSTPEIYGWCKDGEDTFLYMELLEGEPLDEVWESLLEADRQEVCKELREAVSMLGTLRQAKGQIFIGDLTTSRSICEQIWKLVTDSATGNVTGRPIPDRIFAEIEPSAGPFATVTAFHDWLTGLKGGGWDEFREPEGLSDDYNIRLAHGDLHRSNIIVQQDSMSRWKLSGIVDWEMCSWMPEYWDYCRARWSLSPEENATFGEVYLPYIFCGPSTDYTDMYKYWHFFVDRLAT